MTFQKDLPFYKPKRCEIENVLCAIVTTAHIALIEWVFKKI
jgi:hypothetical protein